MLDAGTMQSSKRETDVIRSTRTQAPRSVSSQLMGFPRTLQKQRLCDTGALPQSSVSCPHQQLLLGKGLLSP